MSKITTYYRDDKSSATLCMSASGAPYIQMINKDGTIGENYTFPHTPLDFVRDLLDDWALELEPVNIGEHNGV